MLMFDEQNMDDKKLYNTDKTLINKQVHWATDYILSYVVILQYEFSPH
jgi:hypothetical protein